MSEWRYEFSAGAFDDLTRIDATTVRRVHQRLDHLVANADSFRHQPLHGPLQGLYKYRVGDFRVLYRVDRVSYVVLVVAVKHRSSVYKDH